VRKMVAGIACLVLAVVLIVAGLASPAKERPNSLGAPQFFDNPYTYLFGLPIEGKYVDGNLNLRVQPYATAELFDVSVLFCGDVAVAFEGRKGPLVITYRTQAGRMVQGIGCHELVSVFEVKP
jgi:hypothetical protein